MPKALNILLALACATTSVAADERVKLVGTWKLTSFVTEFQASGERRPVYGSNPRGYAIFTPEGRLMVVITGEGRKPAQTSDERAALLTTMFAYTGKYSVEADRLITNVDASWNEAWTGTSQVRFFKVDGDRLDAMSVWAPSVTVPDKPIVRGILSFEREK
jgi:hypothetical protein